jgi:rfaE bifunctional protein nucleotidyltransferase chain/domain
MVSKKDLDGVFDERVLVSFNKLIEQVENWHSLGLKIALCHGCFDPLHVGHVAHFRAASKMADKLVVTLTPDVYINKGDNRPFIKQEHRLYMVSEIRMVDSCAINLWPTAVETIMNIKPDFFVKGSDYKNKTTCNPNILAEENCIRRIGGKLVYTDEEITYSSTALIYAEAF